MPTTPSPYPAFQEFSRQTKALSGVLAYRHQHNIDVESGGQSGLAEGQAVSGSYFSMLGVRAIRGRTILPYDEAAAGQNPIAVIGYDLLAFALRTRSRHRWKNDLAQ